MSELVRHTETFIVRIWAEYLEQTPPIWRGEIEHVSSKQVIHFRNINGMIDFMKNCTTDKPIQPIAQLERRK
ncbi:MAG: hypothetical protein JXA14_25220 [Anaerolineae bacterium]|nr:hypothetical protein [Anaerolineae bacterium]